ADRFMLLIDRELRQGGSIGFQAGFGVELRGRLDRPRLARAFDAVRRAHPRAGARLAPARGLFDWRLVPDRALLAREAITWNRSAAPLLPAVVSRVNALLEPTRDPLFDLAITETGPEV